MGKHEGLGATRRPARSADGDWMAGAEPEPWTGGGVPGKRAATAALGGGDPAARMQTAMQIARGQIDAVRSRYLSRLGATVAERNMQGARMAAMELEQVMRLIDRELAEAHGLARSLGSDDTLPELDALAADRDAVRSEAAPVQQLAPGHAPAVAELAPFSLHIDAGAPAGFDEAERKSTNAWNAKLDAGVAMGYPHASTVTTALGPLPGQAVFDPAGCAANSVPAFTDGLVTHFASKQPDLHVAAHEAAHQLQHAGATSDAELGAEGHAHAIAEAVVRGGSASTLLGDRGERVSGTRHNYIDLGLSSLDDATETAREISPPKKAKKERDYKPRGNLGYEVGEHHFRFWGFDVNSAETREEFAPALANIATIAKADMAARLKLAGHTSASGGEDSNKGLGFRRAQMIMNELLVRGVVGKPGTSSANVFMPSGIGESSPIADEKEGPEAMAKNRRVEVTIIPAPKPATKKDPAPQPKDPTTTKKPVADDEPYLHCGDLKELLKHIDIEIQAWTSWMRTGHRRIDTNEVQPDWKNDVYPPASKYNYDPEDAEILANRMRLAGDGNVNSRLIELRRQQKKFEEILAADDCLPGKTAATLILKDDEIIGEDGEVEKIDAYDQENIIRGGDTDTRGRKY